VSFPDSSTTFMGETARSGWRPWDLAHVNK
jgi:hypothetical protein